MCTGILSTGIRRPKREAVHPPPSTSEIKYARSHSSIPRTLAWHDEQSKRENPFLLLMGRGDTQIQPSGQFNSEGRSHRRGAY